MTEKNNTDLIQNCIETFTKDIHKSVKSMEKLHDTLSYVKKHPETDKELAIVETTRLKAVAISDALLMVYNLTLSKLNREG
jgi:hypothetical protein